MNKTTKKIVMILLFMALVVLPLFAADDGGLSALITQIAGPIQVIGYSVAVVSLIVTGIMFMAGSRLSSEATKFLLRIIIGIGIVGLAAGIVGSVKDMVAAV